MARRCLSATAILDHLVAGAELLATDTSATHIHRCSNPAEVAWSELVAARLLSAQLDIAQVNDSALDRELYAVVAVIRHFGYMLEGRSFVIFTNHKPLVGVLSRCSDP